jgi:hypothetical protein
MILSLIFNNLMPGFYITLPKALSTPDFWIPGAIPVNKWTKTKNPRKDGLFRSEKHAKIFENRKKKTPGRSAGPFRGRPPGEKTMGFDGGEEKEKSGDGR